MTCVSPSILAETLVHLKTCILIFQYKISTHVHSLHTVKYISDISFDFNHYELSIGYKKSMRTIRRGAVSMHISAKFGRRKSLGRGKKSASV